MTLALIEPRPLALVEPGLYPDVPDEVYHSDRDSLSSSGARTIFFDSPNEFRNSPRVEKSEYDFGHAAHLYVLGKGAELVVVDAPDWRSKDARQAREEIRAAGRVPILIGDDRQARDMAKVALDHDLAGAYLAEGDPELSGWWIDPQTGARLRLRLDWLTRLPDGRWIVVDYKTSKSSGRRAFAKSAGEYGYFMQQPFYVDGLRELGIHVADFVFINQRKTAPYRITIARIDAADVDLGRRCNRKAIDIFARCMAADEWPDDSREIPTVSIPTWTRYRAEELLA